MMGLNIFLGNMSTKVLLALLGLSVCASLTLKPSVSKRHRALVQSSAASNDSGHEMSSRRGWLGTSALAFTGGSLLLTGLAEPANARLTGPASPAEVERIRKGYEGLEYLLANFDKETTKCNPDCNRNPDAVRTYMGLRSMDHPLYQIEKVLQKGQDNVEDVDNLEAYLEACENYSSAISESNAMAYTSSFGEYNPGGGKDAVEKYLNLAKDQVVTARDQLKIILTSLDMQVPNN